MVINSETRILSLKRKKSVVKTKSERDDATGECPVACSGPPAVVSPLFDCVLTIDFLRFALTF